MLLQLRIFLVFFYILEPILCSPLTIELSNDIKETPQCYYILTPDIECTISYYFSVQSGEDGNYNIDYKIYAPDDKYRPIIERYNERQGEWSFVGEHKGEYKICFEASIPLKKRIIDFDFNYDIAAEKNKGKNVDVRYERRLERKNQKKLRDVKNGKDRLQSSIEDSIDNVERQLYMLERDLQYYKNRNTRNHYTVKSTGNRITIFSMYGILLIIAMCGIQLFVLEWVFKKSRKHAV
ncbi:Erp3p NDAI_0A06460 [Naumovozyma dairenensis CBS 421]|uniref:GOLD domain-containing protein n=1 Tax=Naumovozyma dairenensis (strain ATCC 10597 / BCRC 20456 / CBS 421 / NBRC 0211 / NRRL Y-12639) TaxID=1071378 RepID=G0W4R2_NAUDC|nr:hypothetical protein NDAI_0A06460 [Naumovozyma dairenensis CBS 421]CCD22800.1 hypothetical protein NDAI_0A06460 [Naumovozyma dairenensis CBS 421]